MDIDEIYSKLSERASEFKNEFKLKKGLLGKRIQFKKDPEVDVIANVSVKGNIITVKAVIQEVASNVGLGNVSFRTDKNSVFQKGVKGVMDIPLQRAEYLKTVADTIKNILG